MPNWLREFMYDSRVWPVYPRHYTLAGAVFLGLPELVAWAAVMIIVGVPMALVLGVFALVFSLVEAVEPALTAFFSRLGRGLGLLRG